MDVISTVGRRKEAIARVRLSDGKGVVTVNGQPITEYFPGSLFKMQYSRPLEISKTKEKYTIFVKVTGGGKIAQLGAVIHGMARAITKANPDLKKILKKEGYLTRDARVKERRKYGHAGRARAKKQSPKR